MTGMISHYNLLANSLRGTQQNHQVISRNIANVNTPGFKASEVNFEVFLQQVKDGTASRQIVSGVPVRLTKGLHERVDGNNVDLDSQLGELKKNSLLFQTYNHLVASKMSMARRAMNR